jgi:hypothetical protein
MVIMTTVIHKQTNTNMKFLWRVALASAVVLSVAGCASDQAHRYYGSTKYAPKALESVELLSQAPERPFSVIADFQSRGESPDDMRKRGAEIGADAVIVTLLGGYVRVSSEWIQKDTGTSYSRITGTAIVYKK